LPEDWSRIEEWVSGDLRDLKKPLTVPKVAGKDSLEKNTLQKQDWSSFPRKDIPQRPETRINIDRLQQLVADNEHGLLDQEKQRANRAIDYLRNGAPALQKGELSSCLVSNRLPSNEARLAVLKTVKEWIIKGFVAGPFKEPSLDHFRVNGMIAIIKGKHYQQKCRLKRFFFLSLFSFITVKKCALNSSLHKQKIKYNILFVPP
jgi:hypothetical protein